MNGFSHHAFRSLGSLCVIACWSIAAGYAQQSPPAAYFVVSGSYSSSYKSESTASVAYQGTYNQTNWNVSQQGLSIVGSSTPNSAQASYHVDYSWLNAPLADQNLEQWTRLASESIDIYVLGPPGTPFSVTYSFSATVSAGDFSSPCSNGYMLPFFQGQQTGNVLADHVGLTPTMALNGTRTITGVTQNQTITDTTGTEVYSLAWTYATQNGIETGDAGPTSCSPAAFTGSATVDSNVFLAVNGTPSTPAPSPLKDQLASLQPVTNQVCSALAAQLFSGLGGQQIPSSLVGPACWATEAYQAILTERPDSNYKVIDQPLVPYVAPLVEKPGSTHAEVASLNALGMHQLEAVAYAKAILASLQRREGAFYAGDTFWQQKQDEVNAQFVTQLGAILNAQPNRLTRVNDALVAAGVSPLIITADDLKSLQANLAANGIPAEFLQDLNQIGATPSEAITLQSLVIGQDPGVFPKTFPDLLIDPQLLNTLHDTSEDLLKGSSCAADISSTITLSRGAITPGATPTDFLQAVTLTNSGSSAISGPISLALDNLGSNARVVNSSGSTLCSTGIPLHHAFVDLDIPQNTLEPGQSSTFVIQFTDPSLQPITYDTRVLAGQGVR